jgi:hypothetical protein
MNTSGIIENIRQAISQADIDVLTLHLEQLIQYAPSTWIELLYTNNIIPNPERDRDPKIFMLIVDSIQNLINKNSLKSDSLSRVILPFIDIQAIFSLMSQQLNTIDVWQEPNYLIVYRLAMYLEEQSYLIQSTVDTQMVINNTFNPLKLEDDIMPTMLGDSDISLSGAFELAVDIFQLVTSYAMQYFGDNFFGKPIRPSSNYGDVEFSRLIFSATSWLQYRDLWNRVKYLGWQASAILESGEVSHYYHPLNSDDEIRFEIARIRNQMYMLQYSSHLSLLSMKEINKITRAKNISRLARSINVPSSGEPWDGKISVRQLRDCIIDHSIMIDINDFHYIPLLSKLYVGPKDNCISWENYYSVRRVIETLGHIFLKSIEEKHKKPLSHIHKRVFICSKIDLIRIISQTLEMDETITEIALGLLVFSPKLSYLDILDSPLVKINQDMYIFTPSIVISSQLIKVVDDIIAQWDISLFQLRGKLLEDNIRSFLLSIDGIQCQGPVTVKISKSSKIEFDIVVYWQGKLLLIEAKCTKSIYTEYDIFRAKKQVYEASEQLKKRKEVVLSYWDKFRAKNSKIDLPVNVILEDNIVLIAITNVFHFTPLDIDGVIVTDESCFKRFFGERSVDAFTSGGQYKNIAYVRKSQKPNVNEFLTYLKSPPQILALRQYISHETGWLPGPTNDVVIKTYQTRSETSKILDGP